MGDTDDKKKEKGDDDGVINFSFENKICLIFNKNETKKEIMQAVHIAIKDKDTGLQSLLELICAKSPSLIQKMLITNLSKTLDLINEGVRRWEKSDLELKPVVRSKEFPNHKNETKH